MPTPYIQLTNQEFQSIIPSCAAHFITFKRRDTTALDSAANTAVDLKALRASDALDLNSLLKPAVFGKPKDAPNGTFGEFDNQFNGLIYSGQLDLALETQTIVADDDILSCQFTKIKDNASGSFQLVLAPNVNYHALIHPGDYVLIWMKRSPITDFTNSYTSGLKCWGVVTGVRRSRMVSPEGIKQTRYIISGNDWGHLLEQDVYINQMLGEALDDDLGAITTFLGAEIGSEYKSISENVNDYLNAYIGSSLGIGIPETNVGTAGTGKFRLPPAITGFFGYGDGHFASLLKRQFGVFTHYLDGTNLPDDVEELTGFQLINVQLGSPAPLWSILQTYSNPAMNEMYGELKSDGNGKLVPTLTLRQIPFSSNSEKLPVPFAKFSELPRVAIDESCLTAEDIGRSESTRKNLIQMFGMESVDGGAWPDTTAIQTAEGNYALDLLSIVRYGPHVWLPRSNSDLANPKQPGSEAVSKVHDWSQIYGDWYLNAHLLESGTIHTFGIEEPIAVGDNLQIQRANGQNELYHIQSYTHSYEVSSNGVKAFRTSLAVTRGQMEDGSPIYTQSSDASEYPVNKG
jgi:hypothetical protein